MSEERNHNEEAIAASAEVSTRPMRWYVVHTYSGHENKVRENIQKMINASTIKDHFGQIVVPTEEVAEMKKGKKTITTRKFFPSYILIEMFMSDEAFHLVSDLPGVTGFVGTGRNPTPLSQAEVNQILEQVVTAKEKPKPKYVFEKGEPVKIIDGPFNNFTGVVEDVNLDRSTLRVNVTIFGRQTPVELEFTQVQKT